jgi:hypothetical protein
MEFGCSDKHSLELDSDSMYLLPVQPHHNEGPMVDYMAATDVNAHNHEGSTWADHAQVHHSRDGLLHWLLGGDLCPSS